MEAALIYSLQSVRKMQIGKQQGFKKRFLVKIFKIFRKPQIFELIALPERMLALRLHDIITHDNYFYIAAERNAELVGQNL